MSVPLAPNRIHSLPVRVSYYLPSTTAQSFSTIFSSPQQVYVHPNAAASKRDGEDEAWGSIYLKTVVVGVLMASPELHPSHPSTPDLSLYVLDPRETYLRRSRAGTSPYIPHHRHGVRSSSPMSDVSSPNHLSSSATASANAYHSAQIQEVWTGKGLVSWALDEPGQGKNLITGRLVRSTEFTRVNREQGMSALEALMAADVAGDEEEQSWGIEISVGLKSSVAGPVGVGLHNQVSTVMNMESGRPDAFRRSSTASSSDGTSKPRVAESTSTQFSRPHQPLPKRHEPIPPRRPTVPHAHPSSDGPHPLLPTRVVSASGRPTPARPTEIKPPPRSGGAAAKKRKSHAPNARNQLGAIDSNADQHLKRRSTTPATIPAPNQIKRSATMPNNLSSETSEPFPTDIPAGLFSRPESLTREQAQRLLASPAFLSMLEKLTGAPIDVAAAAKRAREGDDKEEGPSSSSAPANKRAKTGHGGAGGHSRKGSVDEQTGEPVAAGFVCWNCGRTKSAVWRTKVMEDGKSVRVCNACGLYWNKMGAMRPPTLWGDVDDDPNYRPRKDKKAAAAARSSSGTVMPSSEPDIPAERIDKAHARSSEGFKRTLSAVVEQDAKRIAGLRHKVPMPKSTLQQSTKPVPMTSPPRGSTSAAKSLRNAKWNGDAVAGASSPGGWMEPMHQSISSSGQKRDNFNPVNQNESPASTIRRMFGPGSSTNNNTTPVPASDANIQTLDMPLSDDGNNPKADTQVEWHTDLSAFFDVDGFSMPPATNHETTLANRTHGISPPAGPTDFHRALSSGARRRREAAKHNGSSSSTSSAARTAHVATDPTTDEDDVLSQLFNRTSSVGMESSSPAPFDFSQLPPSSPPLSMVGSDHLPHSALLLSSPDESPNHFSPMDMKTTPGKSRLRHSISASAVEGISHNNNAQEQSLDFEDIQRMLNNIASGHGNGHGHGYNGHPQAHSQGGEKGTPGSTISGQETHTPSYDMLHELFGKMTEGSAQHGESSLMPSSAAEAEGVVGGEDIFALLEGGAF
ncbi:hypothetical protein CI109_101520 [Kwoniella shandongensis]|uniref:Uncharacterized protein n=1 Tax=Kwoniella shandongensis TaxID=1734106 RepID=A0A5M6C5Z9_9TREE|nr:uncharacterized protein CI109_001348 [Kwoniella shandongensis]KAA5530544.1 hypothetical protein CI109_001348 [Kwoniella shandongensis]